MSWHQFRNLNTFRVKSKEELAYNVFSIVGVRKVGTNFYVINDDVDAKEDELVQLIPALCEHLNSEERKPLYRLKLRKRSGLTIVRCILKSCGHSLERSSYLMPREGIPVHEWKHCSKYLLSTPLVPNNVRLISSQPIPKRNGNPYAYTYNVVTEFPPSLPNSEIKCT